jgi:pilus assembly protein CpaB
MNRRSLITLAVAVVIGLGAMRLSQQMLSAGTGTTEQPTQEVLVAARDVKVEEMLKPDMVKVIAMARSAVPPNSFKLFKEVEERWVKTPLLEGDVLIEKKLGAKGTPPGLVSNIPKGMRALAIDVTEQSGVSGFVLPGHRVDIVRFDPSEKNESRGETILQNVLVLAAGQLFTRPEERTVQSRTVTLALVPGDVDVLVAARAKGALSLALRGVNDHDVTPKLDRKPPIDAAQEKRWQLAEEQRINLEKELAQLKERLAERAAAPPLPEPRPRMRITTIYRGIHNVQRVRTDLVGVAELESDGPVLLSDPTTSRAPTGFRSSTLTAGQDDTEP